VSAAIKSEIAPLDVCHGADEKIVEHEDVEAREALELAPIRPVAAGDGEVLREARNAEADGAKALAARGLRERRPDERFSDARGTDDDHVLFGAHPRAEGGFVEAVTRVGGDVLEGCVNGWPRFSDASVETSIVAIGPLSSDEHAYFLLERELVSGRRFEHLSKGLRHGVKLHEYEFVNRLFSDHRSPPSGRSNVVLEYFRARAAK
jgi:hypothetical protein